jgi:glutamate/tyrosine decarboxylase-like PLP-dependent enzyme
MGRESPFELDPARFRALGHRLVDDLGDFLEALGSPSSLPVTPGESVAEVRAALGDAPLPDRGVPPEEALAEAERLLLDHSLFIGHPRFWGYVVGAPAPIGALGDLLAAAVNPNVGGWPLGPLAAELELQTVSWLAELLGYPADCGGLLVSGGNMANFVGFLAARRAAGGPEVRERGPGELRLRAYCSAETHTWIHKAADMFGLGTEAVRWIGTDDRLRLDVGALREAVAADRAAGDTPFLVVGAAGSVSTGAVDPLVEIAAFCRDEGLWFHVDGAYGAFAACLPDASDDLRALAEADSIAVDPHKWLYAPLEAGCALVRKPQSLIDAFAYRPPYFHLGDEVQFFEYGPQNSRGFRALKVWLGLKTAGREGYMEAIGEDIRLAGVLREAVAGETELEPGPGGLSIATFRYAPVGEVDDEYLNRLNEALVDRLQKGGEAFVSNAVVEGRYFLRACIVNFRTTEADVRALPPIVLREGAGLHAALRVA